MKSPKNILIVRTDRIGDVVLTLPLISILKEKFPDARITFMVKEYTRAILELTRGVDEIIVYDEKKPLDVALLEMKSKKFDTCFVVHPRFRLALLLYLAKIKTRIGTGYRWYSFLFNKKIYEHRKYGTNHELHHNVNLLKMVGIDKEINENNVVFNLQPDENSKQKIQQALSSLGIDTDNKVVLIHPGSGGSAIDLPISHFKELTCQLAQELGISVLLTGSENEKQICEELMQKENTHNLAGKFNLTELISLINSGKVLIANSTGPIHIAAALGKNVIGFYPKIASCSETRWGPYTKNRVIFSPNLDCTDCTREQCEQLNCMSSIKVDEIVSSVRNFLKQ